MWSRVVMQSRILFTVFVLTVTGSFSIAAKAQDYEYSAIYQPYLAQIGVTRDFQSKVASYISKSTNASAVNNVGIAILDGKATSFEEFAADENIAERYVRRLAVLAYLSPRIIQAIVDGVAPNGLTVSSLSMGLPHAWAEQEAMIGLD